MTDSRSALLSKSRFLAGLQCLKRLYLHVHQGELAGDSDAAAAFRIAQGREVGRLAQQAFPGGVALEAGRARLSSAIARTAELVRDPTVGAIFEATFEHLGVLARVDVLERLPSGRWRLIEVKPSTGVKAHHLWDVAVQYHVLAGSGLDIASVAVMHLSRDYVYDGRQLDVSRLFKAVDLTEGTARLVEDCPRLVLEHLAILAQPAPPDVAPGPHCEKPVPCEFYDHCNVLLPADHVAHLPGVRFARVEALLERGLARIRDLPPEEPLSPRQQRARKALSSGRPWLSDNLATALGSLAYPLHFLDFETFSPAIPRFAGMRPYDAIPFQWSLHVQRGPGTEPDHTEFLVLDGADPRPRLVKALLDAVEETGSIVV